MVIKDGGSGGTTIFTLNGAISVFQLFFKGMRINGQLNIALPQSSVKLTVEMSE